MRSFFALFLTASLFFSSVSDAQALPRFGGKSIGRELGCLAGLLGTSLGFFTLFVTIKDADQREQDLIRKVQINANRPTIAMMNWLSDPKRARAVSLFIKLRRLKDGDRNNILAITDLPASIDELDRSLTKADIEAFQKRLEEPMTLRVFGESLLEQVGFYVRKVYYFYEPNLEFNVDVPFWSSRSLEVFAGNGLNIPAGYSLPANFITDIYLAAGGTKREAELLQLRLYWQTVVGTPYETEIPEYFAWPYILNANILDLVDELDRELVSGGLKTQLDPWMIDSLISIANLKIPEDTNLDSPRIELQKKIRKILENL